MSEPEHLAVLGRPPFAWGFPIDAILGVGERSVVVLAQGDVVVFDADAGQPLFVHGVTHSSHLDDRSWTLAGALDDSCTHLLRAQLDGSLSLFDLVHHNPCWQVQDQPSLAPNADGSKASNLQRLQRPISVALSPDGNLAAVSSGSGVALWQEGKLVARLAGGGPLVFSPDGSALLADNTLHDVDVGITSTDFEGVTRAAAFSADGTRLARCVASAAGHSVELWTLAKRTRVWSAALEHPLEALGFSADGRELAGAGSGRYQLWQAETGEPKASGAFAGRACVVSGEPFALFGIDPYDQRLLKLDLGAPPSTPAHRGHAAPVRALALHADANRLVSAADDGSICVWELTSKEPTLLLTRKLSGLPRGQLERLRFVADQLVVDGVAGCPSVPIRAVLTWPELEPTSAPLAQPLDPPWDESSQRRRLYLPVRDLTLEARTTDFPSTGVYLVGADQGEQKLDVNGHQLLAVSEDETLLLVAMNQYLSLYDLERGEVRAYLEAGSHAPPFRDEPLCALLGPERDGHRTIAVGCASGGIYLAHPKLQDSGCVALQAPPQPSAKPPFQTRKRKHLTV